MAAPAGSEPAVPRGGVYRLGARRPRLHPSVFVAPGAIVVGDVELAEDVSVWPGSVLRGDYGRISVGARTNIQDGSVVHATEELATVIGADVVVGHGARLEGCVIEDAALIGMGSILLHEVRVGSGALIAAGAVVRPGTVVPPGAMAAGVPAAVREARSPEAAAERAALHRAMSDEYRRNAARWRDELAPDDGE